MPEGLETSPPPTRTRVPAAEVHDGLGRMLLKHISTHQTSSVVVVSSRLVILFYFRRKRFEYCTLYGQPIQSVRVGHKVGVAEGAAVGMAVGASVGDAVGTTSKLRVLM